MLIYAVADIHGDRERFAIVREEVERRRPDALVVAGDICAHFRPDPERDADELARLPLPVLMTLGNSEPGRFSEIFSRRPNVSVIHLAAERFPGATLVGVSGTLSIPFSSRLALRQGHLIQKLSALLSPGCVLVSHAPPHGACDKVMGRFSAGCKALASLVRRAEPAAVLCGHIHESPGAARMGKTLVVNCAMGRSRGALVRMEGGRAEAEMLF